MRDNAELLRDIFRHFNRSGIDSVLDLMHPQIEVIDLPQAPEERRRRGRDAVAAWFHSRFSGHARASDMDVEQRVAIVCTIRDGAATRWQIYPSRDEAIADATADSQA